MNYKIAEMTVEQWAASFPDEQLNTIRNYFLRWQPIATAPKDGTEILGLFPDYHLRMNVTSMFWDVPGFWVNAFEDEDYHAEPTHWMPLPAPPVTEKP